MMTVKHNVEVIRVMCYNISNNYFWAQTDNSNYIVSHYVHNTAHTSSKSHRLSHNVTNQCALTNNIVISVKATTK